MLYCVGPLLDAAVFLISVRGEGGGMILGLESIREEKQANGMIPMGVDNTAAIIATHSTKLGPGHYLWTSSTNDFKW